MSTRLRLTGLAILIPGIILGLILAGQAKPAMAEPPDDVKDFGLSLDLENTLPPPRLAPTSTPEPASSSTSSARDVGNLPPPQSQVKTATVRAATPATSSSTSSVDCNEYLGWPYPSGWKYNAPDDDYQDVGAYFHVGNHYGTGEPICVRRNHTPGAYNTLCSQAPTWRSIGIDWDGKGYTGRLTFSGQPICLDEQGLRSHRNYVLEEHRKYAEENPDA